MELFIRIKDGQTFGNPIFGDNFRQAFPEVDTNNLPPEYARFVRVEPPTISAWEVCEHTGYVFQDGVWTDSWTVRPMTQEEKDIAQKPIRELWASRPNAFNFTAWVFDENTFSYKPPIPYPEDGKNYFWQGLTNTWVERPNKPNDGKQYKWDFNSLIWVEVIQS